MIVRHGLFSKSPMNIRTTQKDLSYDKSFCNTRMIYACGVSHFPCFALLQCSKHSEHTVAVVCAERADCNGNSVLAFHVEHLFCIKINTVDF